jgi:predicted amidohydrolase
VGHPKVVAACLLFGALATGCASLRWSVQKAVREEGARLAAFPEAVAKEYRCARRRLPFFQIEKSEIVPPRVRSGGEFNHRLVTVLCPVHPTEVEVGRLSEGIRFRGALVHHQTRERFEIRPGRWVLDAFVELPPDAEPGVYAYELRFEGPSVAFERSWSFVIEPR